MLDTEQEVESSLGQDLVIKSQDRRRLVHNLLLSQVIAHKRVDISVKNVSRAIVRLIQTFVAALVTCTILTRVHLVF